MTIVELGPADWEEFRAIRLRALADAPDSFGATLAAAEQQSEEMWRDRLSTSCPILVVRDQGEAVAMGGAWVAPDDADRMWIWGMWTAPEARGLGHGRSLVMWLLDWASARSISVAELHATEGNDTARGLYETCGFVATGEWEPLREGSELKIELLRRTAPPRAAG